ncbi:hypothetical protein Pyn_27208 [Prunus yedoensis var. nudiflora]|uniref:Uncharacterized protein n=1 Tax=Prunus yedoensis var. nudiflora TaxID=2094558 RepID=A0A314UW14_PRUYE|nr:hypothetical protein Pyn_27208 [Prunus yedoensis var. nudiflora]
MTATSVVNATISSAAVTSVSATTTATSMRLGLVDGDATAIEVLAVYAFDRVPHGLFIVEGDETKAPGPLGLKVVDDIRFDDLTKRRKGLPKASLSVEERVGLMDKDPSPPPEL